MEAVDDQHLGPGFGGLDRGARSGGAEAHHDDGGRLLHAGLLRTNANGGGRQRATAKRATDDNGRQRATAKRAVHTDG
ncbi:hypothetical protein Aut01nite_27330 [Actinoplanes utahensis]|nr:hypothetical protein Aut01nite_27330 [Actinoplanes utahensis]